MAAGTVSPEQADVIVKAVDALPSGTAVRARGEATLLEHAGQLRRHRPRPHRAASGACGRPRRRGSEARTAAGPGGTRLPPGPLPLDRRPTEPAESALKGRGIGRGRRPPQSRAHAAHRTGARGRRHTTTELVRDPRDAGARMWDALVRSPSTRWTPTCHPTPTAHPPGSWSPPPSTSLRRPAWPTTPCSELSVSTIRRLACDAEIIPAVLGSKSEPLDVGRAKRLVTLAIWAALVIRDRHCAFPGCDRPPLMCHAHHILHWISGGETKLDNLVLLCGHHHRVIHHSPWEVRLNPDDHNPEFLPPPKPGVARHWIRYRPRRE